MYVRRSRFLCMVQSHILCTVSSESLLLTQWECTSHYVTSWPLTDQWSVVSPSRRGSCSDDFCFCGGLALCGPCEWTWAATAPCLCPSPARFSILPRHTPGRPASIPAWFPTRNALTLSFLTLFLPWSGSSPSDQIYIPFPLTYALAPPSLT